MSVNLLDLAKGYLTDAVIDQASSFMGESKGATQSGLNAALPTLLKGMMGKTSSRSDAQNLFDLVSKPEMGGGLLDNLGGLFSSGQQSTDTMNMGGTLLKGLMGDKLGAVVDLVSSVSGMKSGSSSSLMKLALPILMSVIGKKVKSDGLGLDGFIDLLGGQKQHVEAAAPAGFMDKLTSAMGLGAMGAGAAGVANKVTSSAGKVVDTTKGAVQDTSKKVTGAVTGGSNDNKGGGGFGRVLPLLLILGLLALAAWLLTRNCDNPVADAVEGVADTVKEGADATVGAVEGAGEMVKGVAGDIYGSGKDLVGKTIEGFENLGEFVSRKLADGTELFIPNKGAEAGLVDFIEGDSEIMDDKWFNLNRVLFETGSANLDAKSQSQIDNVVAIMNAYPDVNLKIGGYTDNTGNAASNVTLSNSRATAVMNAIVAGGIDAGRLEAEGYGDAHPVADNGTEEGRAQNRRVAARVTKK